MAVKVLDSKVVIDDLEEDDDDYKYGFVTDIREETLPPGLNEGIIREISKRKGEPEWMLEWRLNAYQGWLKMKEPHWPNVKYDPIDYQSISYYSAPRPATPPPCVNGETKQKLEEERKAPLNFVPLQLRSTFDRLGVSLEDQVKLSNVAVDAVFDSISVATTFKEELAKVGVIFCPISEAIRRHPDLVKEYLGYAVPPTDNFFAALNSAVFSDGSFVYVPPDLECPMELSTYFRMNAMNTGQFERTLIIADEGATVSYLEGCTAPRRDKNQLHAAVVEIVARPRADVKYSTVQNWYPGDKEGRGGIFNFVTKRARCAEDSRVSWTQVETGSAVTWKYPSCILEGDRSQGEFYSVSVVNNHQQADTGTKMIHLGKHTKSTIISKSISGGHGQSTYRGLVKVIPRAEHARNYSQCDSLLMGNHSGAHTFPYVDVQNPTGVCEHEASTSRISEDQLFYVMQRGIKEEDAVSMIVGGFCKDVFRKLPMEFAAEADQLLKITLEGAVG